MKLKTIAAASALGLAVLASPAQANLIQNGSFEANALPSGTWTTFTGTSLTNWTALNQIELRNDVAGTAYDGDNFVELDTASNHGMSQTFTVGAVGEYFLSFFYSARPGTTAATNGLTVVVEGTSFVTSLFPATNAGADHNWISFNQSLGSLAAGSYTLSLYAIGASDSFGTSIDNISVVPEPGGLALMLAGLGAVGFVASRRRISR